MKQTPGDFVPDRKPSGKHNDTKLLPAMIGAPTCDDTAKLKAAAYMARQGEFELWDALGLRDVVERRREALRAAGKAVLR